MTTLEQPTVRSRSGTYPALDGLRAVAALSVVMTHIGFQTGRTFHGSLGALLARLDFGVTIFFLLSGFLLYAPFVRGHVHVPTYLRNRALRVLPAYWVVVLVVVPVMAADYLHPDELADQLFLLQVYSHNHLLPGLTQMWSLCVEVTFYLALPVLALVKCRRLLFAAMIVTSILWTISTRGFDAPDPAVGGLWLPAYLDWFALGMGLAALRAWHDLSGKGRLLDQLGDAGGTCVAIGALLLWLTATPLGGPRGLDPATAGQALTKHLLYGVAALFLLLPAVFGTDGRSVVRQFLEHPLMRWLGSVSYGVFLWHLLVLHLVYEALGYRPFTGHFWLVTSLVVPLSVGVAALSLALVERPALAQKRRWATAGR
jgi:peptidoglycan/LPS O-acetylase OafA/YrhL